MHEKGANDRKYKPGKYETSTNLDKSRANDFDKEEDSLERDLEELKPSDGVKPNDAMFKPIDGSQLKSSKRLQALKLTDIYKMLQAQPAIRSSFDTSESEEDSVDNSKRALVTPKGSERH